MIKSSNQMCISDWLRRTFSAFCQYLFVKIYNISIKNSHKIFYDHVTILLFLSLMTLLYERVLLQYQLFEICILFSENRCNAALPGYHDLCMKL